MVISTKIITFPHSNGGTGNVTITASVYEAFPHNLTSYDDWERAYESYLHREDGPAWVIEDSSKRLIGVFYYLRGQRYTYEEWKHALFKDKLNGLINED